MKNLPLLLLFILFFNNNIIAQSNAVYCDSKGALPWEQWNERVSVAPCNFSNNSGKNGYGDFTSLTGLSAQQGSNNLLTINPTASWNADPVNANIFWRAWIDFNGDGDFDDADEQVISRAVVYMSNIFLDNETNFIIPNTALVGKTRLRIAMKVGGYPSPCEIFGRGEVEDYTIEITSSSTNSCRYQDSLQLVNFYNATNPSTWKNKWNLNTPINTWYGITLNTDGCVVGINLENNTIVGTLPNLNMPNLEFLALRNNVLSGTIPNLNCPKLWGIYLASNQFTGSIPNFNCPNLRVLMLYANQLSGTIPNFNYPFLNALLIDGNQLTGNIPNFNFPLMNHLALSYNKLSGSIPDFNFPVIGQLYLDNNQLSGCIPSSFKAFCGKDVNISNNPGLTTQDFNAFCSNNTGVCASNQPDLTLANLTIPTPSVQQGQTLNFAIDIKNIGTASATGNFTVKAYISTDNIISADDVQNGVIPTGNFIAGYSVLQVPGASTMPATLAVGQYFLILKVDADNQVAESNESNNIIVSATSFSVTSSQGVGNYCVSKGIAPWELWISKVQFNTINNSSEKFKDFATLGYSDYSNLSTTLNKGQTYVLSITPGLSWSGNLPNVYCRAWIDYNGNKTFEPAELVFQNSNVNPFVANIRVPSSPVAGSLRMRIALKWGGYPESCEVFARGEVEDYSIETVVGGTPQITCSKDLNSGTVLCFDKNSNGDFNILSSSGTSFTQQVIDKNANILSSNTIIQAVEDSILVINNQIIRKKANGTIVYQRPIPSSVLTKYPKIDAAVEFSDGTFMLGGVQVQLTPFPPSDSLVLIKTDGALGYISSISLAKHTGSQVSILRQMILANHDEVIIFLNSFSDAFSQSNLSFSRFTKNLAAVGPGMTFYGYLANSISKLPCDEQYLLNAAISQPSIKNSFYGQSTMILELNQFKIITSRTIGEGSESYFGNYLVNSYTQSSPNNISAFLTNRSPFTNHYLEITMLKSDGTNHSKIIPLIPFQHIIQTGDTTVFLIQNDTLINPDCINSSTPNLGLTVTSNISEYKSFSDLTYRIRVNNYGNDVFNNIEIQFPFPAGMVTGAAATPSVGKWEEWCTNGTQCYKWTIPTLAGNSRATLDVPVFILNVNTPIAATARLLSSTPTDNISNDNTASFTINPMPNPIQAFAVRPRPTQQIPIVVQSLSPNPTDSEILIEIESIVEKDISFDVFNARGQLVFTLKRPVSKGRNTVLLNVSDFPAGLYFVAPRTALGRNVPIKFSKM